MISSLKRLERLGRQFIPSSEKGNIEADDTPVERQIAGYNSAQDHMLYNQWEKSNIPVSPSEGKLMERRYCWRRKRFNSWILNYLSDDQENNDMFIEEGSNMFVWHITVDEFKNRLDSIYLSTSSSSKLYSMQDNLKQIILNELIWEDEKRMQTKICRMILILMTDHALYLKRWSTI